MVAFYIGMLYRFDFPILDRQSKPLKVCRLQGINNFFIGFQKSYSVGFSSWSTVLSLGMVALEALAVSWKFSSVPYSVGYFVFSILFQQTFIDQSYIIWYVRNVIS